MLRRARSAITAQNAVPTSLRLKLLLRFALHHLRGRVFISSRTQNNSTLEERLGALLEPEVLTGDNQ